MGFEDRSGLMVLLELVWVLVELLVLVWMGCLVLAFGRLFMVCGFRFWV